MNWSSVLLAGGIAATGAAGYLASEAISASQQQEPTRTVTIDVATGPTGATGPQGATGPPGPAGGQECPPGFSFANVVFNAPGGQETIATCLKNS